MKRKHQLFIIIRIYPTSPSIIKDSASVPCAFSVNNGTTMHPLFPEIYKRGL